MTRLFYLCDCHAMWGPWIAAERSNRQQSYQLIPCDFSMIIWNYFLQMAVMVTSATLHSCATGKHTSGFHSNAIRTSLKPASIGVCGKSGAGELKWGETASEKSPGQSTRWRRSAVLWLGCFRIAGKTITFCNVCAFYKREIFIGHKIFRKMES